MNKLTHVIALMRRVVHEAPLVYPRRSKPPKFELPRAVTSFIEPGIYSLEARESEDQGSDQILKKGNKTGLRGEVIILHVYYEDVALNILKNIRLPKEVDYILTGSNIEILKRVRLFLKNSNCTIYIVENRGRDVYPFLLLCDLEEVRKYSWFWKLHTKRSPHLLYGNTWLFEIIEGLSSGRSDLENSRLWRESSPWLFGSETMNAAHRKSFNFFWMRALAKSIKKSDVFIPGTMFIGNSGALGAIREEKLIRFIPEAECGQLDGTFAHAVERIIGIVIRKQDGHIYKLGEVPK